MNKKERNTKKENNSYKKEIYDNWRKSNPLKQAWHQFNHSRRVSGKDDLSFDEYISLRYDSSNLTKSGSLRPSVTKDLP